MEKVKISQIKDNTLEIALQGKKMMIDLTQELSINEDLMNSQLRDSPSNYAFLCTLRDKAIRKRDKLEKQRDVVFSELWLYYKDSNSKLSNDYASHKATTNSRYKSADKDYQRAAYQANQLISVCRAFESRERILQTLSANLRKQQ